MPDQLDEMLFRFACRCMLLLCTCCLIAGPARLRGQNSPQQDAHAPLPAIEYELAKLARTVLRDPSVDARYAANEELLSRLKTVLCRRDSYDYPFDSLRTISRLAPADDSFRIFTWMIAEYDSANTWHRHRYFGLIQRRFVSDRGTEHLVVIPLQDTMDRSPMVESIPLNQDQWLGALYYHPRNSNHGVLTYRGKYRKADGLTGKMRTRKVKYYVLLGWNGHDISSDYKVIDVLGFDPADSARVIFGAPIFLEGNVMKYRVVFRYSNNSPFSLNLGYVKMGFWPFRRKRRVIVFDHLAKPRHQRETRLNAVGADGSYDAYYFLNRVYNTRRGFFYKLRDVTVYEPSLEKYRPRHLRRQMRRERRRLRKLQRQR